MTSPTPPPTGPRRRLSLLDFGLVLFILGFIALALADATSQVAMVWPYLLLYTVHNQLGRLLLALALIFAALAAYIGIVRRGDVTPLFRRVTYVIFTALLMEAVFGVAMWWLGGGPPGSAGHVAAGVGAVLALPVLIPLVNRIRQRPVMGGYGLAFGLAAALILLSIVTGAV